jgi:peptidoglycan/xylan/chitin deacetylase (PgdA/CDA1 family)
MLMNQGIFTISLDFELHWGGFEKWDIVKYQSYFLNTRQVIPEMLKLFQEFDVHVTWATVGMLFHETKSSLEANTPTAQPTYSDKNLSAYEFIKQAGIGSNEQEDPFHYALSLIHKINTTPNQELGSHTFAHYYCNENGQTVDQFAADLQAAQTAAAAMNKKLTSLVFPRNQFNDHYLKACYEAGFTAVRSNPGDWFWNIDTRNENFWKRINRGLDAYFPVGNKNTFKLESIKSRKGFPICIPASRLLRPYRPQELLLNHLKIVRIKSEMTRAAKAGEVYHLWWHPHNFGHYPSESLRDLKKILTHYAHCRSVYNMQSMNMKELASCLEV